VTWDVVVIGAGAAGLLAATAAAQRGRRTLLLEKNPRSGVKILMSGGTRCNLTHATDARGIADAFGRCGRFLRSALARLGPGDVVQLMHEEGVPTKVEEGGKVFPVSDRAADVLAALRARMERSGAELRLDEGLRRIQPQAGGFHLQTTRGELAASRVILTPGGQSYPGCGTTGDGYGWARELGHTVIPPRPALTPITTGENWVHALRGLTLPDVAIQVDRPEAAGVRGGDRVRRALAAERGSFLFAHFGLSGPVILNLSRVVSGHPEPSKLRLTCDFLPDETEESLSGWLDQRCRAEGKCSWSTLLAQRLPRRLVEALLAQLDLPADRRAAEVSREQRRRLVAGVKGLAIPITGVLGFAKAEVTAGGVSLEEVDSRSMESRRVPGLYLAGEVLDVDGPIGGYNFQAAFSTGWLAGSSV
jgi:predicted Rossmann fold flavoprotein